MADLLEIYFHPAFIQLANQFNESLAEELLGNLTIGTTREIFVPLFRAFALILAKPDDEGAIMELYFKLPTKDLATLDAFTSWLDSYSSSSSTTSSTTTRSNTEVDIDDAITTQLNLENIQTLESIPAATYQGLFDLNMEAFLGLLPGATDNRTQIKEGIALYNKVQRHYLAYCIKSTTEHSGFELEEYTANIVTLARKLLLLLQNPKAFDIETIKNELRGFYENCCRHIPNIKSPMVALLKMVRIEVVSTTTTEASNRCRLLAVSKPTNTELLVESNSGSCSPVPARKTKARNSLSCSC